MTPRNRNQAPLAALLAGTAGFESILDALGSVLSPEVGAWLAKPENKRITLHFTPTGCSWLNMEIFFDSITCQAIRRGTFRSVKDLISAIGAYNDRCQPFTEPSKD